MNHIHKTRDPDFGLMEVVTLTNQKYDEESMYQFDISFLYNLNKMKILFS